MIVYFADNRQTGLNEVEEGGMLGQELDSTPSSSSSTLQNNGHHDQTNRLVASAKSAVFFHQILSFYDAFFEGRCIHKWYTLAVLNDEC